MMKVPPANWGSAQNIMNYSTGEWENGGNIWYGDPPCTDADIQRLNNHYGGNEMPLDDYSLVGKDDPTWTTYSKVHLGTSDYKQQVVL